MSSRFDVDAWLNQDLPSGQLLHQRLSFLVTANGGFSVRGWGILSYGGGHQRGLEQDDALELIQWAAFLDGLAAAGVSIHDAFYPLFQEYQQAHGLAAGSTP